MFGAEIENLAVPVVAAELVAFEYLDVLKIP